MPRLRLTLLLAAAAATLPAAPAVAARSVPVTTTHRDAGVRLQWPAKAARVEVRAGATVRVTVRSLRRRSARVTVTLTRLPGGRVVTRRSLRRGSVSLRLPSATGVRYRLTASAGRRVLRRSTLVVPTPAPAPARRVAPPAGAPGRLCEPSLGPASGTLTGDKSALHYGDTLTLTFTNTSPSACLVGGYGFLLERPGIGPVWQPLDHRVAVPAIALTLSPGRSLTTQFTADDRFFDDANGAFPLQPTLYRVTQQWQVGETNGQPVRATWEFALTVDGDSRCGQPARAAAATLKIGERAWGHGLLRLVNAGGVCVRPPAEISVARVLGDGTTEPAGTMTRVWCEDRLPLLPPTRQTGYDRQNGAAELAAGRYRATATAVAVPAGGPDQAIPLSIDFELDRPIGGDEPLIGCMLP